MVKENINFAETEESSIPVLTANDKCKSLALKSDVLAKLLVRNGIPPLWPRSPGFESLVRIILEQAVSLESAKAVYQKLETQIGLISPGSLLLADDQVRITAGFSKMKWKTCRACAEKILSGAINLFPGDKLEEETLAEDLLKIPGIGPWTVEIYALLVLQNDDIWPVADRALAVAVSHAFDLKEVLKEKALIQLSEPFRPYRSWAARIFWHDYLIRQNRSIV